ncbi:protein kinase PINOID [Rhodamnia argentea]|uniref:non-specific serine/threonine protein kinase n=1 Tax=Rhodamnia argentea TaxID=178133 RepID=A0A8B8MME5_9MYRT|nr:protein kinase PINOID [Rhodamnia argentea]
MIEHRRDSDGELSSVEALNSSHASSMSSSSRGSCSSFSRLSFDAALLDHHRGPCSAEALAIKPHRSSSDSAYSAMLRRGARPGFRDFRLHRRIGSGDIGTVFLCSLKGRDGADPADGELLYAMKVVDKEAVEKKQKSQRAEMERRILKMVDHPFLPTLYTEFEASHFSCIVMEYCSGGDLHSLRHKQPNKCFSLAAARFYAAEVLVALEYLHMLGIIYRDLKPENVLVRSDGHIMLSDFDLSLCSDAIPVVESPSTTPDPSSASPAPSRFDLRPQTIAAPPSHSPFSCLPSPNRFFRSRKVQNLVPSNRLFVAEPVGARSQSFVGTHEYVAPEVASGGSHGNAVDWWALGIFIYEMVYGRTPFAGESNKATLRNIVQKPLAFPGPNAPATAQELHARDLIAGLLCKDPARRLGSRRGSADVKKHPFFKGLNFALVRSLAPPEIPGLRLRRQRTTTTATFPRRQTTAFDYF